ncbi:MAG: ABC-2 type transport system permease protein [Parcubacteria group bacterium Gr01-1014_33]|nr:MAG: ABC-2 type transport system permease protein [Parcubacteria group bacterium Gr01-1014_33]
MTLRYLFAFRHNLDRITDAFYWPTVDLVLWGLTSVYLTSSLSRTSQGVAVVVSGIVLWVVVWRGQAEVAVNVLEEFWDWNLINLFVSPLKFSEWIASFLLIGAIKAAVSFSFAMGVAYMLYDVRVFDVGAYLIPMGILLIMTGWWFGFLVAGLILRYGKKVQSFAWTLIFAIAPFSAVFYPLSVLPWWAQKISIFVPTSYIFEGMRTLISGGTLNFSTFALSFFLNIVYLCLALIFLYKSFEKIMDKGLGKGRG